jgi:hypothetical protein
VSADQGLATAARELLATQPSAPERAEQLDLDFLGMPAYREESTGAQIVPVPERLDRVPEFRDLDEPRRRGTRAGVRNRRTEEWLAYFATRYRSPVENLLAMGNMSIEELCKSLRCSPLEAANIKIRCNAEAAPYTHAKLATIEIKPPGTPGGGASTLAIEGGLVETIVVTPEDDSPLSHPNGHDPRG